MTRKGWKKIVFCLLFILSAGVARAQITGAEIGVNGLTCSQCSRSVEMELRRLSFVADVNMDLDHTTGKILFKKNRPVQLPALSRAVANAGFSTRFLNITVDLSGAGRECFRYNQSAFYFLRPLSSSHPDTLTFQVIGKPFLPGKEYKKYHLTAAGNCTGKEKYYLMPL